MTLRIIGMGHSHPDTIIDNQFLEALNVGTTAQWIAEKIGIEQRRTTLPLDYIKETRNRDPRAARDVASMTPTDLGVSAAKMALERSGISSSEIGLIICNCCTPNQTLPSEAQRIAAALGVEAVAYDVFTACPAFALHMDFLNTFSPEGLPKYSLCVSTAALTQNVNYNDRTDGAIWGDGAAAWIVTKEERPGLRLVDAVFMADPSRCDAVVVDTYGHFRQDGRAVRDFSVRQTVRLLKRLETDFGVDWDRDVFIGHQANVTMLEQITRNREIPTNNHWFNAREYGNQAGAGAPIVLSMNWDNIANGQKVAVAVVGAGLSWGSCLLEK